MTNGFTAKANEKVVVSKDFSIIVPEGFEYSTDIGLINDNRALVFIKKSRMIITLKPWVMTFSTVYPIPFQLRSAVPLFPVKISAVNLIFRSLRSEQA